MRRVAFAGEKRSSASPLIQRKKGSFDGVIFRRRRHTIGTFLYTKKLLFSFLSSLSFFKKTASFCQTLLPKKKRTVVSDITFRTSQTSAFKSLTKHKRRHSLHTFIKIVSGNFRAQVSLLLIVLIIGGTYFLPFGAKSATFSFTQSNWSSGATGSTANHTNNKTGWSEYSTQSGLTVGSDVKLPVVSGSISDSLGTKVGLDIASQAVPPWSTMASAPGGISSGGSLVYPGTGDYIYGTAANNTTTFYRYSISGNSWSTMAPTPGAVVSGSSLVYPGTGDFIYGTAGNNTTTFYRYSISGNTWTTMAPTPGNIYNGASLVYPGTGDYIYGTAGSGTTFYRYSISGNTWTTMAPILGILDYGADLVYPGSGDYIYGTQGNPNTTFYRYSISTNTWTNMASMPSFVRYGGSLVYPGTGDFIYGYQGNNNGTFYRYSLSSNTWITMTSAPGSVYFGASLVYPGTGDYIYGTAANNTTTFYRYSISADVGWTTIAATPGATNAGASLVYPGTSDYIYGTAGNSTTFYRYSISGNSWTNITPAPGSFAFGASLVYPGTGDYIYGTKGQSTTFYRYSISGDTWTTMVPTPVSNSVGASLVYPGTGDYIYGTAGNNTTFYRYSISGNSWSTMAPTPNFIFTGGSLVYPGTGDYIYGTRGYTNEFYRYSISGNTWTTMAPAPATPASGASLVYPGSGDYIYGTGGSGTAFYRYSISGNTWATMSATPGVITTGGSLVYLGSGGYLYGTQGGSTTFYRFSLFNYAPSGNYTSPAIDMVWQKDLTTLNYATTLNGQTLTMDVHAGNTAVPDGTWSAWLTNVSDGGDISSLRGNQYIQYRANFATTNLGMTPTLDSVAINYTAYATAGDLTSSKYNTEDSANVNTKLSWGVSNTSPSADVRFQVRSASSEIGLDTAPWCGYADTTSVPCDGTKYFEPANNDQALASDSPLSNGGDDQWFQYQALLYSDGSITPTLSSVNVQYVVNAVPEFDSTFDTNGITVAQISDNSDPNWGKVRITYKVKDIDTNDGTNTPGFITPAFSYDNGAGFVTIGSGTLSVNALANKGVSNISYTSYEAIWDAKADMPGVYNTNLQVKVTINDNEAANNTASATENILFDGKTPLTGAYPLLVDASLVPASVTLSATDDSSLEMKVGLTPDLSDAVYETYSASKLLSLVTNPDTVYAQYRDIFGNETTIANVASTETPALMITQDISNTATSEWRLFSSWKTVAEPALGFSSYQLYRSVDNVNFSLLTTITSRTTNYYIDDTVTFDTLYYYKIKMTDNVGNVSWFSSTLQGKANGTQDAGEGGGGTETTPPIISNVLSGSLSTTQVTITWNTNELSTSTVGFSVNSGFFVNEVGIATYADNISGTGIHQVILSGLTPATTYYYQVKSTDPSGNEAIDNNGGIGYTFTTNPGPAISGVALSSASNTQATIVWNTDINATTVVSYATTVSGGALVTPTEIGTSDMVKSHSQMITGLTSGTTYSFFVKSIDVDGNIATNNNAGTFYSFTTTTDITPPVISTLSASVITFDRVALTWITDEQSTSQIKYATHSGGPYTATTETVTYGQDHFVIIASLTADTVYYFKAYSTDLSGNQVISSENSFTTLQDPSFQHAPLSSITNIATSLVTDTNAVITLTTDQPAMCSIEYGTVPGSYTATPVTEVLENKKHSITLTSLLFSTTYYYQATCIDNLNTSVVAPEGSFTTKALQVDSGSEGADIIPPSISGVSVSAITGENATVTWTTDENTDGYVRYGITTTYGTMGGEDIVNASLSTYDVSHSVILRNLVPSTKYYYVVLSRDASGNLTTSSEASFTTTSPSTISSLNIVSNKIGEAVLAWKTSTKMSSIVEYGLTEIYGDKQESATQTKEHSITVSKLESNKLYHFRVKGKDALDNLFASSDYTFSPRSLPTVSNVSSAVSGETEAEVSFTTSVPTNALITYINTEDDKDTGSQGKPDLALSHILTLKNLTAGATYEAIITARDEAGNEVKETLKNFTTKLDTTPPEIDQLKTDMALAQDGKVQAIVSWYTNEPATTTITFKEGTGGEERTIKTEGDPSTSHVVVLTSFKMGSVYFLTAKSIDKAGNESISKERMIITPQRTENVVQMIISNFNDMFGWAKK